MGPTILWRYDLPFLNMAYGFNTMSGIFNSIATASQNFLIANGVQISEPLRKLNFLAIDCNRTVGRLPALYRFR